MGVRKWKREAGLRDFHAEIVNTPSISSKRLTLQGSVHNVPIQSGPVWSNPIKSSPVKSGEVRSSPVKNGQVQSGQVGSGRIGLVQVQSCPVQSGLVMAEQDQSALGWSDLVCFGQVRSNRSSTVMNGQVQSGWVGYRTVWSSPVVSSQNRSGLVWSRLV